jgi:transcriptional regulator
VRLLKSSGSAADVEAMASVMQILGKRIEDVDAGRKALADIEAAERTASFLNEIDAKAQKASAAVTAFRAERDRKVKEMDAEQSRLSFASETLNSQLQQAQQAERTLEKLKHDNAHLLNA